MLTNEVDADIIAVTLGALTGTLEKLGWEVTEQEWHGIKFILPEEDKGG